MRASEAIFLYKIENSFKEKGKIFSCNVVVNVENLAKRLAESSVTEIIRKSALNGTSLREFSIAEQVRISKGGIVVNAS